eukprot:SAG11_NODE_363_length_10162_cov_28.285004_9_plen_59_part_00
MRATRRNQWYVCAGRIGSACGGRGRTGGGEGYGAGNAGAQEALAHGRWELELEEVEEP